MEKEIIQIGVRTPLFANKLTRFDGNTPKSFKNRRGEKYTITFKQYTKEVDLTVNAIRGILRWWFRILHAGDLNNLNKLESNFLGTKDHPAKVKFNIPKMILKTDVWDENFNNGMKNKKFRFGSYSLSNRREGFYNGLLYFGHNFYNQSKDKKKIDNTQFYKTEVSSFELSILTNSRTLLNKLLLIFWLALQFGGFGSRSRRGFGNLKILSKRDIPINKNIFSFRNTYSNIDDYKDTVKKNLEIIKQEFGISSEMGEAIKKIPCLKGAQLFYSKPYSPEDEKNDKKSTSQMADAFKKSSLFKEEDDTSWIKAINYAGATMQIFRSLKNPDRNAVHDFSSLKELERAAFGLPLEFRFTDRKKSEVSVNHYNENDEATRFASPVIVSTTEIDNELYVQYLILPFDYNELNVKASNGGIPKKINIDDSVIDQFKQHLQNPPEAYRKFKYEELTNAF